MRRLRLLIRALGPAGVSGVAILLAYAAFEVTAIRPAERELSALRSAEQAPSPAGRSGPPQEAEFRRFYRQFPTLDQLPDQLERLYGLARAAHVDLMRADYRLEDRGAPLAAYHITLPLHAPYPQLRAFIGATLQSMPTVAIDALSFERKKTGDSGVDAQLRLTAYFRTSAEESPR